VRTQTLQDGAESFIVSVHEAAENSPVVLFAVGAGGQPERHATLLDALAESSCTVVAPHFERLASPIPTEADLMLDDTGSGGSNDTFVGSQIGKGEKKRLPVDPKKKTLENLQK
jgi:hypothetical protein